MEPFHPVFTAVWLQNKQSRAILGGNIQTRFGMLARSNQPNLLVLLNAILLRGRLSHAQLATQEQGRDSTRAERRRPLRRASSIT
jgi:hypothetical protein